MMQCGILKNLLRLGIIVVVALFIAAYIFACDRQEKEETVKEAVRFCNDQGESFIDTYPVVDCDVIKCSENMYEFCVDKQTGGMPIIVPIIIGGAR